jgi:hypothetical protein
MLEDKTVRKHLWNLKSDIYKMSEFPFYTRKTLAVINYVESKLHFRLWLSK